MGQPRSNKVSRFRSSMVRRMSGARVSALRIVGRSVACGIRQSSRVRISTTATRQARRGGRSLRPAFRPLAHQAAEGGPGRISQDLV